MLLHDPASPEYKKHNEGVSHVCFCDHMRSFIFVFFNGRCSKCKLGIEVSAGYGLRMSCFPVLFIASVNLYKFKSDR